MLSFAWNAVLALLVPETGHCLVLGPELGHQRAVCAPRPDHKVDATAGSDLLLRTNLEALTCWQPDAVKQRPDKPFMGGEDGGEHLGEAVFAAAGVAAR